MYVLNNTIDSSITVFSDINQVPESLKTSVIFIEGSIPEIPDVAGKYGYLAYDAINNKLEIKYQTRPLNTEEQVSQLREDMNTAIIELSMAMAMGGNV